MSVLAEAISVVVPNAALSARYPRGVDGFIEDCPNRTFCTDGSLARVGFLARRDARFFIGTLLAAGLSGGERNVAADFVWVDQNLGPTSPCLWLEFGREADGTACCWHATKARGTLHAPARWIRHERFAADAFGARPFDREFRLLASEGMLDWYHDRGTGRLVSTGRPFTLH